MRVYGVLVAAVLPFALCAQERIPVDRLSFVAGCWESRQGAVVVEEIWTRPAGDTLLGISRTTKGDKTIFSEFMRIERQGDKIVYVARIGATSGSAVSFPLVRATGEEAVFENPAHDFPQRIIYRKTPQGLLARIEGKEKGKARSEDFPMTSAPCGLR